MGFGEPLAVQVRAVALGVFFGYPPEAIQAYLTMWAHRRGWLELTEAEQVAAYRVDPHGLGITVAPELAELDKAELIFRINTQRYASWPFGDKSVAVPMEDQVEKEFSQHMQRRPFRLRVERLLETLKLYTCPKSVHVPSKEY